MKDELQENIIRALADLGEVDVSDPAQAVIQLRDMLGAILGLLSTLNDQIK